MAKKEQNIMLLQEVVGQLRKLNASSVRDRLREAEEAKRAEQIALQGETQEEQQNLVVDSTEDFRRRFIAGQAKTLVDKKITKTEEGKKNSERNRILTNISDKLGTQVTQEDTETPAAAQTPVAQATAAMENPFIGLIKANTDNLVQNLSILSAATTETTSFIGLIKVNTDSLVQNLSTVKNINFQILSFLKTSRDEDTKRYNTQLRLQEEARKEAIRLNGSGAGAGGLGGMGAAGVGGEDGEDGEGGFFSNILNSPVGAVLGGAAGLKALSVLARMKKWFGFGTKRGFLKTMTLRFRILGRKIFRKFKLSPKMIAALGNPRAWPFILAGALAVKFLGMSTSGDEGEDLSNDSMLPGDLPDLPNESAFENGVDNAFTGLFAASLLSKSKTIQSVAQKVGDKVRANFKAADKNSMKGRLYKNKAFQKGLNLGGRGLLRFLGPWGLGAWVVWEISSMVMKSYEQNIEAAEEARVGVLEAYAGQDQVPNLLDNEFAELARVVAPDNYTLGKFNSEERKQQAIKTIKDLMKGRTQEEKNTLISQLTDLGWKEDALRAALNLPKGTSTSSLLQSNLEKDEGNRLGMLSEFGKASGLISNSGNYVGDTVFNSFYVQGNTLSPSQFEGVTSDMLAQGR